MIVAGVAAGDAYAQSDPRYIPIGRANGALYLPDSGTEPHIGILIVHRTGNFMNYHACRRLSERGYLVLCMNTRAVNNPAKVVWEDLALDLRAGVEFLRGRPGISSVLLWGWSGGGGTTSFYQAVAENGITYCQGPNKLSECGPALRNLPPADGLILVDTNHGIAHQAIARLNPTVVNDAEIFAINALPRLEPDLDPFDPNNGYDPNGASNYSEAFRERYFEAQSRRMNALIGIAQARLQAISERSTPFPDDDIFLVRRAATAELLRLDPGIHHRTLKPQKLLLNSGEIVRQIVESVRLPEPELAAENATFSDGTLLLTLRSFLSANAMRSNHALDDVDFCSSNNSTPCAVQSISVPLLITAMQGNRYLRYNEIHFDLASSEDKDYVIIEGATHPQMPCEPCEQFPGQYSNATDNFFDYVVNWIDERFHGPGPL
ncbi:MAG: hypothetical protein PVF50_07715 [Gammaproteobacteria bacterium]